MAVYIPYEVQYKRIVSLVEGDDAAALRRVFTTCDDQDLLNCALYVAAETGHLHSLTLLCELKADVNFWNSSHDETVLGMACSRGHAEVVCKLVTQGADVNHPAGGNLHTPLHACARAGTVECAASLMAHGANINSKDCFDNTPLMLACRSGQAGMVRYLLERRADHTPTNVLDSTAFSLAIHNDNASCVREMMRAHPKLAHTRTKEGLYPLTSAIRHRRLDMVRAFIDSGCDVNCPEASLLTPLHLAIEVEDEELVSTLVRGGAHLNHPLPLPMQLTPLMVTVAKGNVKLVQALLDAGAETSAFDSLYRSALYLATKFGYLQCMDALLRHGADPDLYHKPSEGQINTTNFILPAPTPLHAAIMYNKEDEAVLLLQAGSHPDTLVLDTDRDGTHTVPTWYPPMFIAVDRQLPWAVKLLLRAGSHCTHLAEQAQHMDEPLIALLEEAHSRNKHPQTLKSACRKFMRSYLGVGLFKKVEQLGLPMTLQNYVLYAELSFT